MGAAQRSDLNRGGVVVGGVVDVGDGRWCWDDASDPT